MKGLKMFVYHNAPTGKFVRCSYIIAPYRKVVRCLCIITPLQGRLLDVRAS